MKDCIDGVDIRDLTVSSLRRHIAWVSQDAMLFSCSVRDNIAYGNQDATDDDVKRAASAANADEFIQTLPQGYATKIGERGHLLSGGQRQRLCIARALLLNAPILILDEATSSLDNESEKKVQDALKNLMRGRTTLVIAHRLSTIVHADNIVVLENGRIVEQGSHDVLMQKNGRFCDMVRAGHLPQAPGPT